jgi:hypothetical protein
LDPFLVQFPNNAKVEEKNTDSVPLGFPAHQIGEYDQKGGDFLTHFLYNFRTMPHTKMYKFSATLLPRHNLEIVLKTWHEII